MTHLETYLDCLKILPNEFQRELVLLGELDRKAYLVAQEIEAVQTALLEQAQRDPTKPQPPAGGAGGKQQADVPIEERLAHLRQLQQMAVDLHCEKLALAKQSRDMIVAYAARLDDDIELFKEELPPEALRAESMGDKSSGRNKGAGARKSSHARRARDDEDDGSDESGDEETGDDEEEEEEEEEYEEPAARSSTSSSAAASAAAQKFHKKNTVDSPTTSADEKPYCICQQPSYGDMVGCDNDDCPYQWFHFTCIGMKKQPKGKWFCDECKSKM